MTSRPTPTDATTTDATTTTPSTALDLEALHAACDHLVASAPNPTTARSVLLRLWALGATAADALLEDLHHLALHHAARTGNEATLTELLHALGRHEHAAAHHRAVQQELHQHHRLDGDYGDHHGDPPHTTGRGGGGAGHLHVAGTPARIHQTLQNRRRTTVGVA